MSVTYIGAVSMVLGFLAQAFGVPALDNEAVKNTVAGVLSIAGFLATCWGRYRAGGVKWFGAKK